MSKTVDVEFPGGKKVHARIGGMVIKTDQSVKNGGKGSAPEPFQLFLASIATCTGIYALEFCRTRKIAIEGMSLSMLCDFDSEIKRYKKITLNLKLPAGFPNDHEEAIIRAMDLCAVKKHIIDAPDIEIKTL